MSNFYSGQSFLAGPKISRTRARTVTSLGLLQCWFQPFGECTEFHRVLDRRVPRQDTNREVLADIFNPTALPDRTHPERDGFIEAFGANFGAVLDAFSIADGDAAGTD
jgi:hypothetical protein